MQLYRYTYIALIALLLAACSKENEAIEYYMFGFQYNGEYVWELNVPGDGGEYVVDLVNLETDEPASGDFFFTEEVPEDIDARIEGTQVIIKLSENPDIDKQREWRLWIGGKRVTEPHWLDIKQGPKRIPFMFKELGIPVSYGTCDDTGWTITSAGSSTFSAYFYIFTDCGIPEIKCNTGADWISVDKIYEKGLGTMYGRDIRVYECVFTAKHNNTGALRSATITVSTSEGAEMGKFTVKQEYKQVVFYKSDRTVNGRNYPTIVYDYGGYGGNYYFSFIYFTRDINEEPAPRFTYSNGFAQVVNLEWDDTKWSEEHNCFIKEYYGSVKLEPYSYGSIRNCILTVTTANGSKDSTYIFQESSGGSGGGTGGGGGGSSQEQSFTASASYTCSFTGGYEDVLPISANIYRQLESRSSITVYQRSNGTYYILNMDQEKVTVSNGSRVLYASDTYQYKSGNTYRTATAKVYVKVWW